MNQYLRRTPTRRGERGRKPLSMSMVQVLAVAIASGILIVRSGSAYLSFTTSNSNSSFTSTAVKCISSDDSTSSSSSSSIGIENQHSADARSEGESKSENENKNENQSDQIHLRNVQAADRDLDGITVDITYNLNVPPNWYDTFPTTSPSYEETMISLHGYNIWKEEGETEKIIRKEIAEGQEKQPTLSSFLEFLQLSEPRYEILGSPLGNRILTNLLEKIKPKIFLEVGVFHGMTSTKVAKYFQSHDGFDDSYVISMDTWLLDIRFTWNGSKSKHVQQTQKSSYFNGSSKHQGGYSTMYYQFLSNCILTQTTNRIVPLPTASQNGAMTLLSHGIRPDFIYVDASHSNPDVHIDFENFYTILKPGGVIAFDDTTIPAVRAAFDALIQKYDLKTHETTRQAHVFKRKEKYE